MNKKSLIILVIVAVVVGLAVLAQLLSKEELNVWRGRVITSLNDEWLYYRGKVSELGDSPPIEGLEECSVPCLLTSSNYEGAWFVRVFEIPKLEGNAKVFLVFYGVKYASEVYVNGVLVGSSKDGFIPLKIDVTRYVEPGSNSLWVKVRDWTSALSKPVDLSNLGRLERPADRAVNSLLYPIGSYYQVYGLWDDVELVIAPPLRVEDVFVTTSYRNMTITVEATVANDLGREVEVTLENVVLDRGAEVLELPEVRLILKPHSAERVRVSSRWADAELWSPWNPYLYTLSSKLMMDGAVIDNVTTRFGFREFWVEDGSYYLNGVKITLRMASAHPLGYDYETAVKVYNALKEASINSMRLHAQPWRRLWYDLADERGVMLVHESAYWCFGRQYRVEDPDFWENFRQHLRGQVLLHRNHPSIVIWSLENELLLTGAAYREGVEARLAELVGYVKKLDPTRPVMFEGDFDPGGAADIVNLHYPHEYARHDQYPNTAFWLLNETKLDSYPRITWKWDRKKPLHIGEFLWVPFTSFDVPAALYGEESYKNPAYYHALAKAEAWKYQIPAYRVLGVSGFCPWNIFEGGRGVRKLFYEVVKETYKPVRFFLLNYSRYVYGGAEFRLSVAVVNDHHEALNLTLTYRFTYPEGREEGDINLPLRAGDREIVTIRLKAPEVSGVVKAKLNLTLTSRDKTLHSEEETFYVHPRTKPLTGVRVEVLREDVKTREMLESLGAEVREVESLGDAHVLVIGRDLLKNADLGELVLFVESGGRVLILEQREIPTNFLEVGLADHYSTIAFPTYRSHPALEGLGEESFRFWFGDHVVSYRDLRLPLLGSSIPLVQSGCGLRYAQLLEVRLGEGVMIFSQLAIASKYEVEPRAGLILSCLVKYLAEYEPLEVRVGVYRDTSMLRTLDLLGVEAPLINGSLEGFNLVLVNGSSALPPPEEAVEFLKLGGVLYVYGLSRGNTGFLKEIADVEVEITSTRPPAYFLDHYLVDPVGSELLYWPTENRLYRHGPRIPDPAVTSRVLTPVPEVGDCIEIPLSSFRVVEGELVFVRRTQVEMYTNGRVSANISAEEGYYAVVIEARGTPFGGEYPVMQVSLNGELASSFTVGGEWRNYTVIARLDGRIELSIAFVNDAWEPGGEDRNLYIRRVWLGKANPSNLTCLAKPCVLAVVPVGRGLVVIDQIPWAEEILKAKSENVDRALRLACRLLTALGVRLKTTLHAVLTPRDFEVTAAVYHVDRVLALYSEGVGTASIEVPKNGAYKIIVAARGDPAAGEAPIMEVAVDDETLGDC